jgi:hypothetical protein
MKTSFKIRKFFTPQLGFLESHQTNHLRNDEDGVSFSISSLRANRQR